MTTLRILLNEHWPEPAQTAWVLIGNDGKVESEGTSDPRHWPAAQHTEAFLTGAQMSWISVRVPNASVREQAKSIRFALEEQLVREPDSQHITPTLQEAESWSVLVAARERMKQLNSQFIAIGRPLDALFCAAQNVPWEEGVWSVAINETSVWVKTAAHGGFSDDLPSDGSCPTLLTCAVELARTNGTLPHTLRVYGVDVRTINVKQWGETLGLPIEVDPVWTWHTGATEPKNLLHGEFSSRHRDGATLKLLKPACLLMGLVITAHLVLGTVQVLVRRSQLNSYKAEMTQLLRSQMPNISIQNPASQLRNELNKQRTAHGQIADDEAISLLADLSAAMGADANAAIAQIKYEAGSLTVTFNPNKANARTLISRLDARNISATEQKTGSLTLRRKS